MATPKKAAAKAEKPKAPMTKAAAARSFARRLQSLPDAYIECRDMRHSYVITHDFHAVPGTIEGAKVVLLDRVLGCTRCPKTRVQHFKQGRYSLEKLGETVSTPKDYSIPGIPRGVKTQIIVQQEAYRRAMEKATGAKPGDKATPER